MKFLIVTFFLIGCVFALPAPAPAPAPLLITFDQYGGGQSRDVQGLDYAGDQVSKDVGDTVDSAMDNLDAKNAGKSDLAQTVNNLGQIVKEPLGWALGTVGGLATGALQGVGGALKGLKSGGLGGALRGLTGGLAKGASKGFSNGLGGLMGSSGTV